MQRKEHDECARTEENVRHATKGEESNSPRNADTPMTRLKPSATLIGGRTGMLANTTQVSTGDRKGGVHSISSADTNASVTPKAKRSTDECARNP